MEESLATKNEQARHSEEVGRDKNALTQNPQEWIHCKRDRRLPSLPLGDSTIIFVEGARYHDCGLGSLIVVCTLHNMLWAFKDVY